MSDFFELIRRRESCRSYDPSRPVEHEKLVRCLEAARLAPSACNSQPWRFIAVSEPVERGKLCACVQGMGMNGFASDAPVLIAVLEEKANLSARVGARFTGQSFAGIDIGLAVSQLCLAASELGLSTCVLGWLAEDEARKALSLAERARIRLVVTLGYSDGAAPRDKKRKPFEKVAEIRA